MHLTKQILGHSVSLRCHDALGSQAEWLLGIVEEIVAENGPEVLRNGYRVQVGWSILTLVAGDDGSFVLHEPDFARDPFRNTRDDLTCTLKVQVEQNDFVLQLGVEALATSFQDKIVYEKLCFESRAVYLERKEPKPGDSGWFIGRKGKSSEVEPQYEACFAYEILNLRPEFMNVLQLPVGYLVVFEGPNVEAVLNPKNENIYSI